MLDLVWVAYLLVALATAIWAVLEMELRYEGLIAATVTASANSQAEFRNDSSRVIHIREMFYSIKLITAANDEFATCELSKSPVFTRSNSNNPFFSFPVAIGASAGTIGSGADDVCFVENGSHKWAKGQLTLEPGESLFLNVSIGAGAPSLANEWELGYHF